MMKLQLLLLVLGSVTTGSGDDGVAQVVHVSALLGGTVKLPCDTTPPTPHNPLLLTVWFKDQLQDPIYSYDVREDIQAFGKHWYDDGNLGGRAFFGGENKTSYLSIENLKQSDQGAYRCRVDFKQAPSQIYKLYLEVVVPPTKVKILTQSGNALEDERYNEGTDLKLSCFVSGGKPSPQVTWFLNNQSLASRLSIESNNQDGSVSSSLSYGSLSRGDHGSVFTCSSSNTNLTSPIVSSAQLKLKLLPLLVRIDSPQVPLVANMTNTVSCTSYGSNPPAVISWWLDAVKITNMESEVTLEHNSNSTNSVLKFVPKIEDAGKFLKCRAENIEMTASQLEDSRSLEINYLPRADLSLGPTLDASRIKEGDDVYFECNIDAKPAIYKTSWWFNGVELKQNVREGIIMGNRSLVLQSLTTDNTGLYACQAANSVGRAMSNSVDLDIKYKPVCSLDQKKIYGVARGEMVAVNCSVNANPGNNLRFRWTFNNTSELANIQDSRFSQNGSMSQLIYAPVHELDYGTILCWAGNNLGEQEEPCTFHIIPAGSPEPPLNCNVSIGKTQSLDIVCEPGFDGGLPQEFTIIVINDDLNVVVINKTSIFPSFSIQGLSSNKSVSYKASVYSYNLKGKSEVVTLPEITLDAEVSDLNGPITRAAQEGKTDKDGKSSNSIVDLELDTRNDPGSPVMSILCGVIGAVVVVFLVIIITMKIRCGRMSRESTWHRKDCSSESSFEVTTSDSPDLLVKGVPSQGSEYHIQSIYSGTTNVKPQCSSSTLPRLNTRGSHYSMDSLMTLQGLPPPPAAPPVERMLSPELETVLPPPSQFHTLPRLHRSVSGVSNSNTGISASQCAARYREVSGSISSIHSQGAGIGGSSTQGGHKLRRSNSHVESIV